MKAQTIDEIINLIRAGKYSQAAWKLAYEVEKEETALTASKVNNDQASNAKIEPLVQCENCGKFWRKNRLLYPESRFPKCPDCFCGEFKDFNPVYKTN